MIYSNIRNILILVSVYFIQVSSYCQQDTIYGSVKAEGLQVPGATVLVESKDFYKGVTTNEVGEFSIIHIGEYPVSITVQYLGYNPYYTSITSSKQFPLNINLIPNQIDLKAAEVEAESNSGIEWMNSIDKGSVYRGIKSSVIRVDQDILIPGEVQARSIFTKIPGVNMWESDAAGLQIGIGVRGLNPNRSAHLSVRQNGSPIAADPLGYPESYYSPPIEAVSKIEYVSGASALQYGSQLGGMLNFQIKSGKFNSSDEFRIISSFTEYQPLESLSRSNYNIFAEHTSGKKNSAHYFCFDLKSGQGWRENTDFDSQTFIVSCSQNIPNKNGKLILNEEFTIMNRLEHQPGGLTDNDFNSNPRISFRDRNWFKVDWRILRSGLDFKPNHSFWSYNLSLFKLDATRQALGFIEVPSIIEDLNSDRNLISANFNTGGYDIRATRIWDKGEDAFHAIVLGSQGYLGSTQMKQGNADSTSQPNFIYNNPENLEGSDFNLPNSQFGLFCQGIISLSKGFSVTPGIRWEYIDTRAQGSYRISVEDFGGNVLLDSIIDSYNKNVRHIFLPGIGFSFKMDDGGEIYGNAVSNFRAVNFSDIQIQNLGVVVDPNISDEKGANFDIGYRNNSTKMSWDISIFMLNYSDKIGVYPATIPDPLLIERAVFLRTNISNARTYGLECLLSRVLIQDYENLIDFTVSTSIMSGKYIGDNNSVVAGKEIEYIPSLTFRSVLSWKHKTSRASVQLNYIGSQYTDATNALIEPTGVYGEIPAYGIVDCSFNHKLNEQISLGVKMNNVLDNMYFTRRATGYPGPGIIPSDGRNIRFSLVFHNP